MDVTNAEYRHKQALESYNKAIEQLATLTRADGEKAILQARTSARDAWKRLGARHHELVNAYLEKLGW